MVGNPFSQAIARDNVKFFETRKDLYAWVDELKDIVYIVKNDEKYNGETTVNVKENGDYKRINGQYEVKQQTVTISSAPKDVIIDLPYDDTYRMPDINVLKETPGATNQTVTLFNFTNDEENKFEPNEFVDFDGSLKLKTSYTVIGEDIMLDDGYIAKSFKIDKSKYKNITAISIV